MKIISVQFLNNSKTKQDFGPQAEIENEKLQREIQQLQAENNDLKEKNGSLAILTKDMKEEFENEKKQLSSFQNSTAEVHTNLLVFPNPSILIIKIKSRN